MKKKTSPPAHPHRVNREAEALRLNLAKRKAQARARQTQDDKAINKNKDK